MGATLAEKILRRACGREVVKPGDYVMAKVDVAMSHDSLAGAAEILDRCQVENLWDSEKVVCILDHWNPSPTVRDAEMYKRIRATVKRFGIKHFHGQNAGVCHQVMFEKGHVLPGRLIVGADSHTPIYGAFGAAGAGIGVSEMAYVLATGKLWFRVPDTIKFVIEGEMPSRVSAKDIILSIAGRYSVDVAQYRAVEFHGETCAAMSLSNRMTIANMAAEIGAKFAFFEPDKEVEQYLEGRTSKVFTLIKPDKDASYENVYQEDVSDLVPQVAFPFSVDNVKPVTKAGHIRIDQAVLGSCTNGRLEDLKIAVEVMGGKKVHPDVRMLVIPASAEVYHDSAREGVLESLIASGAIICNPGCGPCMGAHMGVLASGETCIATTNRNFRGRMGSDRSELYLASPATVAASAVKGWITDPRDI